MPLRVQPINRPGFALPGVAGIDEAGNRVLLLSTVVTGPRETTTIEAIADKIRGMATRAGGKKYNATVNIGFRVQTPGGGFTTKYPKLGSFSNEDLTGEKFEDAIDEAVNQYMGGGLFADLLDDGKGELIGAMVMLTQNMDAGGCHEKMPQWAQDGNHCLWFALRTAFTDASIDIIAVGLPQGGRAQGEIAPITSPAGLKRLLGVRENDSIPASAIQTLSRYMGRMYRVELRHAENVQNNWEDTNSSPSARRIPFLLEGGHYSYDKATAGTLARSAALPLRATSLTIAASCRAVEKRLHRREVVLNPGTSQAWERISMSPDAPKELVAITFGAAEREKAPRGVIIVNCGEAQTKQEAVEVFQKFDSDCRDIQRLFDEHGTPNYFLLTGSVQQAIMPLLQKHLQTLAQPEDLSPLEELFVSQALSGSMTYLSPDAGERQPATSVDRNGSYAAAFLSKCKLPRSKGIPLTLTDADEHEYIDRSKRFARLGLYRLSEESVAQLRDRSCPWRRFIRGPPSTGQAVYTNHELTAMLQLGFEFTLHIGGEANAIVYGGEGSGATTYQSAEHVMGAFAAMLQKHKFTFLGKKTIAKTMMAAAWGSLIQRDRKRVRLGADARLNGTIESFEVHTDGAFATVVKNATAFGTRGFKWPWARVGAFIRGIALADTGLYLHSVCCPSGASFKEEHMIRIHTDGATFRGDTVPEAMVGDIDPMQLGWWKVENCGAVRYDNVNKATWQPKR